MIATATTNATANATANATRYLWTRIGEGGNWQRFDDVQMLVEYFNLHCIGKVDAWMARGFCTPNYWGRDYVILYWGDEDARRQGQLLADERQHIEDALVENYL